MVLRKLNQLPNIILIKFFMSIHERGYSESCAETRIVCPLHVDSMELKKALQDQAFGLILFHDTNLFTQKMPTYQLNQSHFVHLNQSTELWHHAVYLKLSIWVAHMQ